MEQGVELGTPAIALVRLRKLHELVDAHESTLARLRIACCQRDQTFELALERFLGNQERR